MEKTDQHGRYYWCVKVVGELSKDGEIYVLADEVRIVEGALCFHRKSDSLPNLTLAPGKWLAVYASSLIDGSPVAVQYWKGEIITDHVTYLEDSGIPEKDLKKYQRILEELSEANPSRKRTLRQEAFDWIKEHWDSIEKAGKLVTTLKSFFNSLFS